MIVYEKLQNLKYNNTPLRLPKSPKKQGVMIFLNTFTETESMNILNSTGLKNMQMYPGYFLEYRYKVKEFGRSKMQKIDTRDIYSRVKSETFVSKTYKNIALYNTLNTFTDLNKYNDLFFNLAGSRKGILIVNNYVEYITNLVTQYSQDYDKKIMVFDISSENINYGDISSYSVSKIERPLQILIYTLGKDLEKFKTIGFEILILNGNESIYINPELCDKESFKKLLTSIKRFSKVKTVDSTKFVSEYKKVEKIKSRYKEKLKLDNLTKFSFNGNVITDELEDKVDKAVDEAIEDVDEIDESTEIDKQVEEKLNQDEEFLSKLQLNISDVITSTSKASTKRNMLLAEKQAKIKINNSGKTIEQILNEADAKTLKPMKLDITTLNPDMKEMVLPNFCKTYNENLFEKDMVNNFDFLKDLRVPAYVLDIKKEDSSTKFDKKETWTVKLETGDRERHTLKFDVPKFVDDSFLYLGGNRKNIINQLVLKPIVKTGPDTVQLCTAYNKIFVRRSGVKISPKLERFKKALGLHRGVNTTAKLFFKTGDNSLVNVKYKTNMEFDELAAEYMLISINNREYVFHFNIDSFLKELKEKNINVKEHDDLIPVALKNNKEVMYLNTDTNKIVGTNYELVDFLIEEITKSIKDFDVELSQLTSGKRFLYSECTIMAKKVPMILLLSYLEGLTTILKKAEINCEFSDKRKNLSPADKSNKEVIQFADGYLYYDRYPFRNSLLLNALSSIPTKEYNYSDFDNKETYLDIFGELFNNKMILNAFENFYDLFIDPISKEVLQDLNLPDDFVGLLLCANNLLEDNQFVKENNQASYRIRNNEIINTIAYQCIADAYSRYRTTVGNKHPEKISVPQDCVIKGLLMLNTVEDYSKLNPILEAEKLRAVSYKGPSGMNMERAFTLEKRAYDKTMQGIIAMSSPPSGAVGIIRQLAMDANITSPRGYLKIADSESELNSANMFCPSELLTTFCAQYDDAPRVAMVTTQSKHVVPCKGYSPLLITNGADRALGSVISNDFVFKAKQDGKVIDRDDEAGIIVIEYKDKSRDVIETYQKIYKNGGGGFYTTNQITSDLKVGNTFKAGEVLGVDNKFFDQPSRKESVYKGGVKTKIAMAAGFFTYEDSAMITKTLSRKLATEVAMKESFVLGKNSNVEFFAKRGQHVEVGDPLLLFDESYSDDSINKLLASLSAEQKEQIEDIGRVPLKAKHPGIIEDIKVYYTVEKDELSPSLRKFIDTINAPLIKREKAINKHVKLDDTNVIMEPTHKVEAKYGKVKGTDVGEGVLIEYYINHEVDCAVGDKIIMMNALKSVICKVIPEGLEPYSEFRPEEEISAFLSPISYLARMTNAILVNGWGNKLLIEGKRKMEEIYKS